MNIKLLYYLILNRFKEYKIRNTDNLRNYLSNLDNLIISKQKELAYLKAKKISNLELVDLIKTLKSKYNLINNILTSYKTNTLMKIHKLEELKLNLNNNYSKELKIRLNKYINHNILYYNNLLNGDLVWYDYKILSSDYNIEHILENCNNYVSINENILCMINYNIYKCKYIDNILLDYLNSNNWELPNITNHKLSSYINNKINIDLGIDKTISINYILDKLKLLIKLIKTNIIKHEDKTEDEIVLYLGTMFDYIILDFDVEFWRNYIQELKEKNNLSKYSGGINDEQNNNQNINKVSSEESNDESSEEEDKVSSEEEEEDKVSSEEEEEDEKSSEEEDKVSSEEEEEDEKSSEEEDKVSSDESSEEEDKKSNEGSSEEKKKNKVSSEESNDESSEEEDIESDNLLLPENIVKPKKMTIENTIQFSIKNKYAWLSLDWSDIEKNVRDSILVNYSNDILNSVITINNVEFDNLVIYLYLKKMKYMKTFLDNNRIDMMDYIKGIFNENGNYRSPNEIIDILDKNFDNSVIKKIEKGKVLEEFNELVRDWNKQKIEVIRIGLYNKYTQNKTLKLALLNTKNKYLVDVDDMDDGKNIVGIVSMQVRYILSN